MAAPAFIEVNTRANPAFIDTSAFSGGGVSPTRDVSSGAAIAIGQLVKPTAGGYIPLATTDDGMLATGVATQAAGGAGVTIAAAEALGQVVNMLSDGTAINIGDPVYNSTVVGGNVSAVVSGTMRGIAITAAAAGAQTLFEVVYR